MLPVSFGGGLTGQFSGFGGYNSGPVFKDERLDQIAAQGKVDRGLQKDAIGGRLAEANLNAGTARYGIDVNNATDRYRIGTDAGTARRGQDVSMALGNRQADVAQEGNRLQYEASIAPINWQREKFGTVFPWVQNLVGGLNGSNDRVGGTPRDLPGVTVGGVYSDQDTQQQVNAARAGIDQSAASQGQRAATKLAGQGFGPRSPLLAAMQQQIQGQAMATGADAEREIRHGAATENAKQRTSSEALAQQQWRDYEDSDIRRRQVAGNQTSALLSALAQFV